MASITFSSDNLRKLLRINSFPFSEINYMVFGIRGASPVGNDFDTFKVSHQIERSDVDYLTPKCTIGIWNAVANTFALFPASTVPHIDYIKSHIAGGARSNCIMSGFYSYYEKGVHNPSQAHKHPALRLATNIALRRSTDDLVYTNLDPVEVGNPNDNLHAAFNNNRDSKYSSAGCQVIVGQPKCIGRGANSQNTAFWKKFYDIIYGQITQTRFDYTVFRYADAEAVAAQGTNPMQARLRFGSRGNIVKDIQEELERRNFFYTVADGDFGRNTLRAVLDFQTAEFGVDDADGVVGGQTAGRLGIVLPMI